MPTSIHNRQYNPCRVSMGNTQFRMTCLPPQPARCHLSRWQALDTKEKIIAAVKQMEGGRKTGEVARELGVRAATLYAWKSKYGGMQVSDAKRLRQLEEENRRLKHIVADLSLDKEAIIAKKRVGLVGVRENVAFAQEKFELSERRAWWNWPGRSRVYGYRRLGVLLEREGIPASLRSDGVRHHPGMPFGFPPD